MTENIEKAIEIRTAFLKALYEADSERDDEYFDSHELGRNIGITNLQEISKIVNYLYEKGLIDADLAAGIDANAEIKITAEGKDKIESQLTKSLSNSSVTNVNNITIHGDFNADSGKKFSLKNLLLEHITNITIGLIIAALVAWFGLS
jgi:limonene-1,2-epoxide hydrolase